VTFGGGVKCWGYRIGGSDSAADTTPADVPGLERDIQAVAVGNWHVCVLTKGGGVKCWGDNYAGQLGNGSDAPSSTPVDVKGLGSGVQAISLGATHSCALTTIGDVYCWGSGAGLADGVVTSSLTPQRVQGLGGPAQAIGAGSRHTCAVISGAVQCWGDNWWGQLGQDPGWLPMDIPLAMRLYLSIVNR
jgi:alpha-tubulin suppressor-like RCC1 family protein